MINFKHKKEEELALVLPEGFYRCRVIEAKEAVSKAGHPKISLKLATNFNDRERFIYCDLMFHAMEHITRHFFDSCGKIELYESDQVSDSQCLNQTVYANVIQEESYNDPSKKINRVKDFVTSSEFERIKSNQKLAFNGISPSVDQFKDDELPF